MRKANRWMIGLICLVMLLLFVGRSTHPQFFSVQMADNKIDKMTVDRSLESIAAEESQLEVQREQVIDESLAAQNAAWDECAAGRISFTEWQKRNAEAVFLMHPELRDSSLSSDKVHVLVNGDRSEQRIRPEAKRILIKASLCCLSNRSMHIWGSKLSRQRQRLLSRQLSQSFP